MMNAEKLIKELVVKGVITPENGFLTEKVLGRLEEKLQAESPVLGKVGMQKMESFNEAIQSVSISGIILGKTRNVSSNTKGDVKFDKTRLVANEYKGYIGMAMDVIEKSSMQDSLPDMIIELIVNAIMHDLSVAAWFGDVDLTDAGAADEKKDLLELLNVGNGWVKQSTLKVDLTGVAKMIDKLDACIEAVSPKDIPRQSNTMIALTPTSFRILKKEIRERQTELGDKVFIERGVVNFDGNIVIEDSTLEEFYPKADGGTGEVIAFINDISLKFGLFRDIEVKTFENGREDVYDFYPKAWAAFTVHRPEAIAFGFVEGV